MSVQQEGYKYFMVCDGCGTELPLKSTFIEAVKSRSENGWKSIKEKGEGYIDLCPYCYAERVEG